MMLTADGERGVLAKWDEQCREMEWTRVLNPGVLSDSGLVVLDNKTPHLNQCLLRALFYLLLMASSLMQLSYHLRDLSVITISHHTKVRMWLKLFTTLQCYSGPQYRQKIRSLNTRKEGTKFSFQVILLSTRKAKDSNKKLGELTEFSKGFKYKSNIGKQVAYCTKRRQYKNTIMVNPIQNS